MAQAGFVPRESPLAHTEWHGTIERLGWGGLGVGRSADGKLVLLSAPLALIPGEEVSATVRMKAKHGEGAVTAWLTPDPRRVEPGCPVAERCGGCRLWGAGELYAELKHTIVADLLRRSLPGAPVWTWRPAPQPWGEHGALRHRIQLHWDGVDLGFHTPGSHEPVPVLSCPMAIGPVSAAIAALRKAIEAGALPDTPGRWELAAGTPPEWVLATSEVLPGQAWRLSAEGWAPTTESLANHLGGVRLDQPPGAFFQACPAWAWEALGEALTGWDLRGATLYDLYGGVGLFSAMLAGRFQRYVVVESDACAAAGARANLARLGLKHEVVEAEVEDWLARAVGPAAEATPESSGEPADTTTPVTIAPAAAPGGLVFAPSDALILDPPRAGLGPELCAHLSRLGAGTLVFAGCDGATFCRDVRALRPAWRLTALAVLDLFPNTAQVECVGLLKRK